MKLFGHPIHQMLIVFPLGLLATAVIFDLIYLIGGPSSLELASWYMIAAGIIGGLVSAVFGLVDWIGVDAGTRAKRIGAWHGIGNVVVVALFFVSWVIRRPLPLHPPAWAFIASYIGAGVAMVTGWLGGELVDRLGVGVDDGANPNAPSSLSGEPVREKPRAA